MHRDDAVVRELAHVTAIVIANVNFLFAAARSDERDFAGGETFIAGKRLNDIIGKAMRVFAHSAAVAFRKNDAAIVVDHLTLQTATTRAAPRRVSRIPAQRKVTGERQIVRNGARLDRI